MQLDDFFLTTEVAPSDLASLPLESTWDFLGNDEETSIAAMQQSGASMNEPFPDEFCWPSPAVSEAGPSRSYALPEQHSTQSGESTNARADPSQQQPISQGQTSQLQWQHTGGSVPGMHDGVGSNMQGQHGYRNYNGMQTAWAQSHGYVASSSAANNAGQGPWHREVAATAGTEYGATVPHQQQWQQWQHSPQAAMQQGGEFSGTQLGTGEGMLTSQYPAMDSRGIRQQSSQQGTCAQAQVHVPLQAASAAQGNLSGTAVVNEEQALIRTLLGCNGGDGLSSAIGSDPGNSGGAAGTGVGGAAGSSSNSLLPGAGHADEDEAGGGYSAEELLAGLDLQASVLSCVKIGIAW